MKTLWTGFVALALLGGCDAAGRHHGHDGGVDGGHVGHDGGDTDADTDASFHGPPPPPNPAAEDVILGEGTTAEALATMLAKDAGFWEWSAGRLKNLENDQVLPASPAFEFQWASDLFHLDKMQDTEPPLSGVAFLVLIYDRNEDIVLAYFTKEKAFTPSGEQWTALQNAEGPLTIHVNGADFEANELTQFGGPYYGPAITFSITAN